MKTINITLAGLMASGAFVSAENAVETNQNQDENQFTLSARLGFNIHAKFSNNIRLTPDRLRFNYLDGYVLPDYTYGDPVPGHSYDWTGTFAGATQNWGYDNSARQRDGTPVIGGFPTVAMTRYASGIDPMTKDMQDDPTLGLEFGYKRRLGTHGDWRYGIELAFNFQKVNISEGGMTGVAGVQDYYQYWAGGDPLPTGSWRGTYATDLSGTVYNPLISDTPAGSASVPIGLNSRRELDADVWGFRLGPYLERQFGRRWAVNVGAGLAVAIVDATASWSETITINGVTDPALSGSGSGTEVLWGYYAGANATYHLNRRWDITGGVQYQDVGVYHQNAGTRTAELDLSESIFVQLGVSYNF